MSEKILIDKKVLHNLIKELTILTLNFSNADLSNIIEVSEDDKELFTLATDAYNEGYVDFENDKEDYSWIR